jgi:two-component system cell cycle sensor histidine kinase PleC
MARALSAPHGESHAFWLAARAVFQRHPLAQIIAACRAEPQRCILLLSAIVLVAGGIAVPHLSDESLATLLFLTGAGLAALCCLPWHPVSRIEANAGQTTHPRSHVHEAVRQERLTELADHKKVHAPLDLDRWARLTAHMSHELRTPLNAVLGFSELMSNEVLGPLGSSCYATYARDIHASGRVLLKSAEDALAITALLTSPERQGPPPTCRLDKVAEDACNFARYDLASKSGAVVRSISPGTAVIGDSQATRQILINLIAEATRNSREGATLSLKTSCNAGFTRLSIAVAARDLETPPPGEGFAMILARTLSELSGAYLAVADTSDGARVFAIDFLPATQNDLFDSAN